MAGGARNLPQNDACPSACLLKRLFGTFDKIVIEQNALRVAVQIVILTTGQRPYQNGQAGQADKQCRCDNQAHGVLRLPVESRRAFNVTSSEDPAMVAAAINGVTMPNAAIGMAVTL